MAKPVVYSKTKRGGGKGTGAHFRQNPDRRTEVRTGKDGGTRVGVDHCTSSRKHFDVGYGHRH